MKQTESPVTNRRSFLRSSSTAAVAGAVAGPAILGTRASAASPGDTIKVGLIGCGGRGSGAADNALAADPNTVITAIADLDDKTARRCVDNLRGNQDVRERVQVEPKNVFSGFDAYKGVIDSGCDVVLLATPPGFRPVHMAAAVAAGKHMFVEKPMATDAPGLRSIMESVAGAKAKKLAVCAGFCWRYATPERALFDKVLAGDIGQVQSIYATYNTGHVGRENPREGASPIEQQIRRWYFHKWLSGDFILEQAIHAVDWMCWAMGDAVPVKAIGLGGRQTRPANQGDIFDHFAITYEYSTGARGFVFCRQQPGCANDNSATIFGTKGTAYEVGFGRVPNHIKDPSGKEVWRFRGDKVDMYVQEHREFFASLRSGKPINDGDRMASSTLVGLMGRMAAYTGIEVTREMALNSKEQLVPNPITPETPAPEVKVAMPGKTKFI